MNATNTSQNPSRKKPNYLPRNATVAVFMDYENVFYGSMHNAQSFPNCQAMIDSAAEFGRIVHAVAICDWTRLSKGIPHVVQAGIEPVFACHAMTAYNPAEGGGKEKYAGKQSSSDSHLYTKVFAFLMDHPDVEVYVIVSGDRDFSPMVYELKRRGKFVIVMSEEVSLAWDLKAAANYYFTFQEIGALIPAPADPRFGKDSKTQTNGTSVPETTK